VPKADRPYGAEHFLLICGQAFELHPRCALFLIRGRTKEAYCILQKDGSVFIRDSHRLQQVDVMPGNAEESLAWLVEYYAQWFVEAREEEAQPGFYYEMHNIIDVTIVLPPDCGSLTTGQAESSEGSNPFLQASAGELRASRESRESKVSAEEPSPTSGSISGGGGGGLAGHQIHRDSISTYDVTCDQAAKETAPGTSLRELHDVA